MGHIVTKLLLDESMGLPVALSHFVMCWTLTALRRQKQVVGNSSVNMVSVYVWSTLLDDIDRVKLYRLLMSNHIPTAVPNGSYLQLTGVDVWRATGFVALKTLPIREAQYIKCSLVMYP